MDLVREKKFHIARLFVKPWLHPSLNERLENTLPELTTMQKKLEELVSEDMDPLIRAESMQNFVALSRCKLSYEYRQHLLTKANYFDKVSGFEGQIRPSDVLIATEPAVFWMKMIGRAMANAAELQACDVPRASSTTATASTQAPPPTATPAEPTNTPAEDDREVAIPENTNESAHSTETALCPILDIHLAGETIREAWESNPMLRELEKNVSAPVRQDPHWTPQDSTALPVFHATQAPGDDAAAFRDVLSNFDTSPSILEGNATENQVVPNARSLPVVWTGFSPFRCFLWAAFGSEVITDIPGPTPSARMLRPWTCHRAAPAPKHDHCGILLLQFYPRQSALSSYTMPANIAEDWTRYVDTNRNVLAHDIGSNTSTAPLWSRLAHFHGQPSGTTWPEVIHCSEISIQASMLSQFTRQTWRSVWYGKGIKAVNEGRYRIMSLSLRIVTPPETPVAKPSDSLPRKA